MAKENKRKTMQQILEESEGLVAELNMDHVNDWHYGNSSVPFKIIQRDLPPERLGNFNITAAISSPKSIKYRQMSYDWEGGKKGDYLFADASNNNMTLPYILFKRLF